MASLIFERPSGQIAVVSFDATPDEGHYFSATVTEHPVEVGSDITDHVRAMPNRLEFTAVISNTPVDDENGTEQTHRNGATGILQGAELLVENAPRRRQGNPILVNPGLAPSSVRDASRAARFGIAVAPQSQGTTIGGLALTVLGSLPIPGIVPEWKPQPMEPTSKRSFQAHVLQYGVEFDRVRAVFDELSAMVDGGIVFQLVTSLRTYDNMVFENMGVPRTASDGSSITVSLSCRRIRTVMTETVEVKIPEEPRAKAKKSRGNKPPEEPTPAQNKSILKGLFGG